MKIEREFVCTLKMRSLLLLREERDKPPLKCKAHVRTKAETASPIALTVATIAFRFGFGFEV